MAGTTYNPYRFGGQFGYRTDAPSNRLYIRQRQLDTTKGRWLSRDPVSIASTNFYWHVRTDNLYEYAYNNPALLIDPLGQRPIMPDGSDPPPLPPRDPYPLPPSRPPIDIKKITGCDPSQYNMLVQALHEACTNRIKSLTDKDAINCITKACKQPVHFRCPPQSNKQCTVDLSSYPNYRGLPGYPSVGLACSFNGYRTDPPGTIHICPSGFTNHGTPPYGCGCLGRMIFWEMLNNCGKDARDSDASNCPQADVAFPKGAPCP